MRTHCGQSLVIQMVYFCSCMLIWILLVSPIGISEGRSVAGEEYFPMSLEKRNSWWSKKSLENIPNYHNENLLNEGQQQNCDMAIDIFKCYSEICVPDFVACSRSSDDVYEMCKIEHTLCTSRCFNPDTDNRLQRWEQLYIVFS